MFGYENLENKTQTYVPTIVKSLEYQIESIAQMCRDPQVDKDILKSIIRNQHRDILNIDNLNGTQRESIQSIFTSEKFLDALYTVINTLGLSSDEIRFINKMCYDYISKHKDPNRIEEQLLAISYMINDRLVIKLSAYMDMRTARIVAILRNSSLNMKHVVNRVNKVLLEYPYDNARPKQNWLVDVYLALYDRMMYPIVYTFLYVSNQQIEFHRAALILLLNMSTQDMYEVVQNYIYNWNCAGCPAEAFSLKSYIDIAQKSFVNPASIMILNNLKESVNRTIRSYSGLEVP